MHAATESEVKIKSTLSRCPQCLDPVDAEVVRLDRQIWLRKTCPQHGEFSALLSSDARHYYEASNGPDLGGACCGPSTGSTADSAHSCTVLIEICERCNLTCPTCFAGSSPSHSKMMDLDTFRARVDGLLASGKQSADMIQLSGGEPTIHPELVEMLEILFSSGFPKVTINSNGIKLAQSKFVERLANCVASFPGSTLYIYLQFDGFDDKTHLRLRGRSDLLELKQRAITNCIGAGLIVHPVMTLTRGVNDHEVGKFVRLAIENPEIKHVVIQPAMYSGRYENERRGDRLTLADAVALVVDQFGAFTPEDFGPIPCSDPNCHSVAVALRTADGVLPVSRYFPKHENWNEPEAEKLVEAFSDTINGRDGFAAAIQWAMSESDGDGPLRDLDDTMVDAILDAMAANRPGGGGLWERMLTISIKPFMDAWTYDQDRINKCCVHILDEAGNPVSLCEFNAVTRPRQIANGGTHA